MTNATPIDVWFKFYHYDNPCISDTADCDYCEEASHEANTFLNNDGTYRVEWYLNAVGLVTTVYFNTLADAHAWYEREDFYDFSS